jgi:hypothetical protein
MAKPCEECGTDIVALRSTKRFCKTCLRARNWERDKKRITLNTYGGPRKTFDCARCGGTFESPYGRITKHCLPCRDEHKRESHREWARRPENRERRLQTHRDGRYARRAKLAQYGLTLEAYDAIVAYQQGRCAICQRETPRLVVDHCHDTNRVRGLLCSSCNSGIGALGDTEEHARRAIAYLQRGT